MKNSINILGANNYNESSYKKYKCNEPVGFPFDRRIIPKSNL